MKVFKVILSVVFAIMFVTIFSVAQASDVATKKSQRQVMHDFMKVLAEHSYLENNAIKNLDYAINKSSNGLFTSTEDLKQKFMRFLSNPGTTDKEEVLLKGCGINFKNNDTGAITGSDAGGKMEKNYLSIVPEPENTDYIRLESVKSQIPNDGDIVFKGNENVSLKRNGIFPDLLMNFKNHDLIVKVDNYFAAHLSLNESEKIVVDALYNWWIEGALNLNKDSYGIDFNSPTSQIKQITLVNNYNPYSHIQASECAAYVNSFWGDAILGINTQYYVNLDLSTQAGRNGIGNNFPKYVNPSEYYLDRSIAHEFTHAIMKANVRNYDKLPTFLKEGMAELTIGADDKRKYAMLDVLLENYYGDGKLLQTALRTDITTIETYNDCPDLQYAAGYMLLRYFAKQVSDSTDLRKTSGNNTANIPSDALSYNGHNYYVYSNVAGVNTWEDAKKYCESLGGHLAVINDKAENDVLYNYITSRGHKTAYFGLSDSANEGTWKWLDDSVNYYNWFDGEPNGGRGENYAEFYYKFTDGRWNDGNFGYGTQNDSKNFICEWDSSDENYRKIVPDISTNETEMLKKLVGTYKGSYANNNGDSGMTLNVFQDIDGTFKATWDFYNLPGKNNTRAGKTKCKVSYDVNSKTYTIQSYEWINKPEGYIFMTLQGQLNGDTLSGNSPARFSVTRINEVPDISTNETEMLRKLVGVYKGSYFAGQDEVGTTLTIFEDIDGTFKAVWDFYNLSNKTNFYEGNTRCHVKYDVKTRMYSVQSYEWIDRKLNYPFLTLSGSLNGNLFSGDHQYKWECEKISVNKTFRKN